nr:hypothetical protein [Candidatus Electrothrix aestuarii]
MIVTIFVPSTAQGKRGKIGTGYPVAGNLILTSRHVMDEGSGEIQVRWHYFTDEDAPDNGWIPLTADDIVWKGEKELDAVLLRCPRPKKAQWEGWGKIINTEPNQHDKWHSLGFSRATQYNNLREPDNVSGTIESMAGRADHFELTVNCPPEELEMWQGVSGMPVFVDKEILGVVRYVPDNFKSSKLYAVPSWKMFENEKFRKLISVFQRNSITKIIKNIEGLFERNVNEDALRKLVSLCTNEKRCERFYGHAEKVLGKYNKLKENEENENNASYELSLNKIELQKNHISSLLLLVEMKIFFKGESANLTYKKEALRLEKEYNRLYKRKIKIEDELNLNRDPNNTAQIKNILECLHQTMKYLRQTIDSIFTLIEEEMPNGERV